MNGCKNKLAMRPRNDKIPCITASLAKRALRTLMYYIITYRPTPLHAGVRRWKFSPTASPLQDFLMFY